MPMTFASQIGGMGTPIGTSLNLLVIGSAASLGIERFHMFDFIAPATLAAIPGLLFLWLVAPRLLPEKQPHFADTSPRIFDAQLHLTDNSPVVGKTLADAKKLTQGSLSVLSVRRTPELTITPLPDMALRGGDQLLVRDTSDKLMEYSRVLGATLFSGETRIDAEHPLTAPEQQTAELVLTPASPLRDRTLAQANFDWHYQLIPLAVHRPGEATAVSHDTPLRDVRLGVGDVLLVQGPAEQVEALKQRGDLLVLDATTSVPLTAKAPLALAIMAGIVIVASLRIAPVAIAAICGVLLMVATGCLKWKNATRALDSPMADNCNVLVYSAGGYSFRDFLRVGLPLTLIMWLALTWTLPRFYPLQ
jgi:di/tricarboxylate transporter